MCYGMYRFIHVIITKYFGVKLVKQHCHRRSNQIRYMFNPQFVILSRLMKFLVGNKTANKQAKQEQDNEESLYTEPESHYVEGDNTSMMYPGAELEEIKNQNRSTIQA